MIPDQWHPGSLLAVSGSYWHTCTLHTGVKLGIFTALGDNALTGSELAEKLGTDGDGTARLLNALTAMALLEKKDGYYRNTPTSRTSLSKDSDQYIGYMILHHHHLMESWNRLDEAVTTGRPIEEQLPISREDRRENFLMGMFNTASLTAPDLARAFDLSSRRHLLDLGGGPGTYAIYFCRENPQLKATVFDLPATRPFAEKTIARFDLAGRINFLPGDFTTETIPGRYDVVWLSHILHSEPPDVVISLIKKILDILEPGGILLVHDFILDDTLDGPLFPALFSLNMLVRTESGRSYSEKQITDMLMAGGFKTVTRHPFRGPTESGVMIGTR
ncbi:MAG: SAM-dependent methyltransferase [Deltaproteobacteria bacterium]|nr:MAG: SAM-dependent methyltransferase [Deltaproteobacteria bacterium]